MIFWLCQYEPPKKPLQLHSNVLKKHSEYLSNCIAITWQTLKIPHIYNITLLWVFHFSSQSISYYSCKSSIPGCKNNIFSNRVLMNWQVILMIFLRLKCVFLRKVFSTLCCSHSVLFVSGTPEGLLRFGWMSSNCSITQLDQLLGGSPMESEWLIACVCLCVYL